MDPFLVTLITICACSVLAGFIGGIMVARMSQESTLRNAKESVRREFVKEKEELAQDLGSQMKKLRDSISLSIGAYESTLETIEAKLNIREEEQQRLKLDSPKSAKRIDYQKSSTDQDAFTNNTVEEENQGESPEDLEAGAMDQELETPQDLDLVTEDEQIKKTPLIH